jgi:phenylacetate-CoA ligase
MNIPFHNRHIETLDRNELACLQLHRLRASVDQALKTPFYRQRLAGCGLGETGTFSGIDDLRRIPFTVKDDLRASYPSGLLAVPKEEVVRVHMSSGTTGSPTVIHHTAQDIATWTDLLVRSITATGVTKHDVFQNMMTYGLFTGGLALHYAAEKLGMMVIPAGPGNTRRQIKLMKDFATTVVHATPSYLLHLYSALDGEGIGPGDLALKRAFLGAEPYSENTRLKIEALLGIDAYNSYGLSEMNGPGVAFECVCKAGMHVWEDAYLIEVIDPRTLEPVPDGIEGELVFTTLRRQATPLLRYRTRDLSAIIPQPCACGRTHRRVARIKGRSDDMLIINGVNVYPSQIEGVLMKIREAGSNYLIVVEKDGSLDRMIVKTEVSGELFTGDLRSLESVKRNIGNLLKTEILFHPAVELHEPGALPVSEGKARRVVDNRAAI